jgi:hypothetical protein
MNKTIPYENKNIKYFRPGMLFPCIKKFVFYLPVQVISVDKYLRFFVNILKCVLLMISGVVLPEKSKSKVDLSHNAELQNRQ